MDNIKFSVVMIAFNTKEEYLREAILSVLNQKYSNFEFIIVDDGSNTETAKIIDEYNDKATVLHQSNSGQTIARINGSKLASGEYVVFVDSDDYISDDTLSTYNQIITKHNVDIVLHDFVKFTGNITNIISHVHYFEKGLVQKDIALKQLCLLHQNGICGRAVKKDLLANMGNHIDFSIRNGEDLQQSAYTFIKAKSFFYTDKKLYYYRIFQGQKSYYNVRLINNFDFMSPVYNIVFFNNNYETLLAYYKQSAIKSLMFNAFRIYRGNLTKEEKKSLICQINDLEIVRIIQNINKRIFIPYEIMFFVLNKKIYPIIEFLAVLFEKLYGIQQL